MIGIYDKAVGIRIGISILENAEPGSVGSIVGAKKLIREFKEYPLDNSGDEINLLKEIYQVLVEPEDFLSYEDKLEIKAYLVKLDFMINDPDSCKRFTGQKEDF